LWLASVVKLCEGTLVSLGHRHNCLGPNASGPMDERINTAMCRLLLAGMRGDEDQPATPAIRASRRAVARTVSLRQQLAANTATRPARTAVSDAYQAAQKPPCSREFAAWRTKQVVLDRGETIRNGAPGLRRLSISIAGGGNLVCVNRNIVGDRSLG
jgi:hypothetical protein